MYLKHFPTISAYCYHRNGLNQYLAEEATAKAFDVLYKKWNTLRSHDEKTLKINKASQREALLNSYWLLNEYWSVPLRPCNRVGSFGALTPSFHRYHTKPVTL